MDGKTKKRINGKGKDGSYSKDKAQLNAGIFRIAKRYKGLENNNHEYRSIRDKTEYGCLGRNRPG
jgi:hypothetical protein